MRSWQRAARPRGWRALLAAATAVGLLTAQPACAAPERIVSLNLCVDQLVLMLAERRHIASVSFLAADPSLSVMAAEARTVPLNHGRAEEILPLKPDLVLAGRFGARPTVRLLRRLGYRVVELDYTRELDDVPALITRVGALVGAQARAARINAAFRARIAALKHDGASGSRHPLAAIYNPNGYTAGAGTLADSVVRAAGFENLARRLGIAGTAVLPLEHLLVATPVLLITTRGEPTAPSRATDMPRHPALRRAFSGTRTVNMPNRLWICGGPAVADAMALLIAARQSHAQRHNGGDQR